MNTATQVALMVAGLGLLAAFGAMIPDIWRGYVEPVIRQIARGFTRIAKWIGDIRLW